MSYVVSMFYLMTRAKKASGMFVITVRNRGVGGGDDHDGRMKSESAEKRLYF